MMDVPKPPQHTCESCGVKIYEEQAATTKRTLGRELCTKCASKDAAESAEQFTPEYLNLEMLDLLEKAGWKIQGWSACRELGAGIPILRVDFKELPLQAYTRLGEMPWTEIAKDEKLRHPKVHDELLKVQKLAKQAMRKKETPASKEPVNQPAEEPAEPRKQNLPARQEKAKPPGKPLTDAERDALIEKGKAEKFLTQRGSSYKVQGKERPDSHMIQKIANDKGVCIEIIEAYQNDECAHVVVRGYLNNQYVDAIVHHDFKTEYLLKIMEIAKKNPHIIERWDGTTPILKADAVIETGDREHKEKVSAQYFVTHALLSFKKFALRDGRTKAASIAEAMLLNRDWRDEEERQSEEAEFALVQESIRNRKGVGA